MSAQTEMSAQTQVVFVGALGVTEIFIGQHTPSNIVCKSGSGRGQSMIGALISMTVEKVTLNWASI